MDKTNSSNALDLYAKAEDLLGVYEVAPKLYNFYYNFLDQLQFNSLLDIGCGGGTFLQELHKRYPNQDFLGIDKSSVMVSKAKNLGVTAKVATLKELEQQFDVATAVFDMINYLTPNEFIEFFAELKSIIKPNGYFIFDLNSEYGLSELAVGNFIAEDENRFLAIESFYENGIYDSDFTLFEKERSCYKKFTNSIRQYFYSEDFLNLLNGWQLQEKLPIKLYEMEEYDKDIYIFKRDT